MLTTLYPEKTHFEFEFCQSSLVRIRVRDIPTVSKLVRVLDENGIDPVFVVIDNMWGRLNLVVCNYDGTDIDID